MDVTVYSETIEKHFKIVLWSKHLRSGQWRRFETSTCSGREEEGEVSCDLMQEPCRLAYSTSCQEAVAQDDFEGAIKIRSEIKAGCARHNGDAYCIILSAKSLRSFETT